MSPPLPLLTFAFVNILQPYNYTAEFEKETEIGKMKDRLYEEIQQFKILTCQDASGYCNYVLREKGEFIGERCRITIEGVLCQNFTTDDDFKRMYHKLQESVKREQEDVAVRLSPLFG